MNHRQVEDQVVFVSDARANRAKKQSLEGSATAASTDEFHQLSCRIVC
jgi:hypothetical protein